MITPAVYDKHHDENKRPSSKGTSATGEIFPVEDGSHDQGAHNLGRPVKHAVQRTRADVEEGACAAINLRSSLRKK